MPALPHIVIACSRLDLPSGYEKAICATASLFSQKGHPVTLFILDETDKIYFPLAPGVRIVHRNLHFGITSYGNMFSRKIQWWKHNRAFAESLHAIQGDILLCTEFPFTVAAVQTGLQHKMKVYAWEHHHFYWLQRNRFWKNRSDRAYRKITGVICLNHFEEKIFSTKAKTCVIPNFTETAVQPNPGDRKKQLLTVAGLIPRKGIDMLLEIAEEILTHHPDWTWKLIGQGEMQKQVIEFIEQTRLEGKFILQNPTSPDISKEFAEASIYVMTSRFEAFPLVLLEAMAAGLPAVSFDCPSGPAEIIVDGVTGKLVPPGDMQSMIAALQQLIQDEKLREQYGAASWAESVRYSPDAVYEEWKKIG